MLEDDEDKEQSGDFHLPEEPDVGPGCHAEETAGHST